MQINPNYKASSFTASIHKENVTKGVLCFFALCILGGVAALHHNALETFIQNHRTFTTLLLPIGTLGMVLAGSLQYTDRKKQLFLACLATVIVAYILSGLLLGFSNTNMWIHQHGAMATLAFFVGFSGFLILNSKKPFAEKPGEISPLIGFDEIVTDEEPREVFWNCHSAETQTRDLSTLDFRNQEKALGKLFVDGQIVNIIIPGYREVYYQIDTIKGIKRNGDNEIIEISGKECFRSIAIMSEKRPVLDDKGQPTGEHYVRLYTGHQSCHTTPMAGNAFVYGFAIRFGGGILYNILRIIPLLFLILARTGYDLAIDKENRSLDLVGRRIYLMHKVIGDSLRGIVKNALGFVAASFATLCLFVESAFSKGEPIHSQTLLAKIEQWVNDVPLRQSYWATVGFQDQFNWEGNFDLERLNEHGAFIMGCCNPLEYGKVDANGNIVEIVNFGGEHTYRTIPIQRPFEAGRPYTSFIYRLRK